MSVNTFNFTDGVSGKIVHGASYVVTTGWANVIVAKNDLLGSETRGFEQYNTATLYDDFIPTIVEVKKVDALAQPSTPPDEIPLYIGNWIGATLDASAADFNGGVWMMDILSYADNTWMNLTDYAEDPLPYIDVQGTTDIALRAYNAAPKASGHNFNTSKNKMQMRVTGYREAHSTITETFILSPVISKLGKKVFVNGVVLHSFNLRLPHKTILDIALAVDTLFRGSIKRETDTIRVNEVVEKAVTRVLLDGASVVDALQRAFIKLLADAAALSDTLISRVPRSLMDILGVDDQLLKSWVKTLTEAITASETAIVGIGRKLVDSLGIADAYQRLIVKRFAEALPVIERMRLALNGIWGSLWSKANKDTDDGWRKRRKDL